MKTQELRARIAAGINNILTGENNWSYSYSDIDGVERCYIISPYNIRDALNIYDIDKYDLFSYLSRSRRFFTINEHYTSTHDYDCSGDLCGRTFSIEKMPCRLVLIQSWSYDV